VAYFKVPQFKGIAPQVSPRLLAEGFAQTAQNVELDSGRLVPIEADSATVLSGITPSTLQSVNKRSVWLYIDGADASKKWLQGVDNIYQDFMRGPIANDAFDRVYWTGDTYPQFGLSSTMISGTGGFPAASYRLGLPAPAAALSVSKSGTADATQIPNDVSYVYTYVDGVGAEGPPSPPSAIVSITDTETVALSSIAAVPAVPNGVGSYYLNAAKKRIYRSNTGTENTQFQFLAEIAYTATAYTDTTDADELGEVLPSSTWIGPPNDVTGTYPNGMMLGLVFVSNGIAAGFTGNTLCLSEPYLPHAWPADYRISIEEPIVGLGVTGNGIAVLTEGTPYFVTGADPAAMTAVRLDTPEPCVNKQSIVDMGEYVLYAGTEGLVAISGNETRIVTKGIISPKQWNADFNPTTLQAFRYEDTYIAFNTTGTDYTGWVFDSQSENANVTTLLLTADVRGGYIDQKNGDLYLIISNTLVKWRGHASTLRTLTYKTRKFVTPAPTSMSWVSVDADTYPVTIKVYGDGTLIAHYVLSLSGAVFTQTTSTPGSISNATLTEPVMRLPATVAQEWEVEASGATIINEVCIAQSIDELRAT
tara:strand:- start:972 stop:2741 length:1770 start_codon:yes stop_codon:yes gene_type:complete